MSNPREIRGKISSIRTTQKITNAMQQVAISKMHKARKKMEASLPYVAKVLEVMGHVANSDGHEQHPYLQVTTDKVERVGYIVVSTDRGLCGGLNMNLFRVVLGSAQQWQAQGVDVDWCLFGKKADWFFRQAKTNNIVAKTFPIGETPEISTLLGGIKVMLDAYLSKRVSKIFIAYNEFVSSMVQRPRVVQLVPFSLEAKVTRSRWDYIYEPEAKELLDTLLTRYIESQIYQAVVDNLACEQVARMVAMQNATDNATDLLEELHLLYNKARQAMITKELAEIVEGSS